MGLFGGNDESVQTPTLGGSVDDWLVQLPKLMGASEEYAPQQAQLGYDLFSQYAPQYAETQADIYSNLFPETYGLQEQLAQIASEGSMAGLTPEEERQFLDLQKSLVGEQTTSGIGTDYIGSNLLNYVQGRRNQNQNLGLSLLGRIPQTQLMNPSTTDFLNTNQSNLLSQSIGYPFQLEQMFPQTGDGFDLGGAISGAVTGASASSTMGPWGMLGGAAIGGLGGGFA